MTKAEAKLAWAAFEPLLASHAQATLGSLLAMGEWSRGAGMAGIPIARQAQKHAVYLAAMQELLAGFSPEQGSEARQALCEIEEALRQEIKAGIIEILLGGEPSAEHGAALQASIEQFTLGLVTEEM